LHIGRITPKIPSSVVAGRSQQWQVVFSMYSPTGFRL